MKSRSVISIIKKLPFLLMLAVLLVSCQEKKYHIAVSLCFNDDWHNQLNKDLTLEASTHPELIFSFKQADFSVEKQKQDIEQFLEDGMDLLIISPSDTEALSPTIEKVFDQGIPVIMIDSKLQSGKYTASIGVDNNDIGERAGSYAVYLLKGKGKIIEVRGSQTTSTAIDRHTGFVRATKGFPETVIVDSCDCSWNYQEAYDSFALMLSRHPDVDLVFAANDVMALAVYDVCVDQKVQNIPYIIGVDGLSGTGKGVSQVLDGKITATCINPTGGFEAVNLAKNILEGGPFERNTLLKTALIFQNNASLSMMMDQQRNALGRKIEEMNGSLIQSWQQISQQRLLLTLSGIICLMLIWMILSVRRQHKLQSSLQKQVEESTKSKLDFFSNVSHSFRTPLTLIIDPMHQLIKEGGLSQRQNDLLQIMSRNTDELLDLTNQVLTVLQTDPKQNQVDVDAIARDAVNRYQKIVEFRNTRLGNQVHPELLNEAEHAPQSGNEETELKPSDTSRPSILIIDDNPDVRQYINLTLGKEYVVLQAPNGQEGLILAQQNIPDLIICDVMMPIMDGLECCKRLKSKETTCHIPVIMLTAYGLDDQRILGYQSGADAYITKPFNIDVLRARIENLLYNRKRFNAVQVKEQEEENEAEMDNHASATSFDRNMVEHFHQFILANISNTDLGIQDLCDEFNMSRVQVYRKFKSLTGQSPVELIRIIRLNRAKKLLESTDSSVSEVAFEVGFSSASYFAKCYRDQFNETPTDVQKRVRENK